MGAAPNSNPSQPTETVERTRNVPSGNENVIFLVLCWLLGSNNVSYMVVYKLAVFRVDREEVMR